MPRIPDQIADAVFYLYPTREAAEKGEQFGGSGFFYGAPVGKERWAVFAVTNWHVAVQGGCSVIRLNCKDGSADIFETDPSDWEFEPKSYDLAVMPFRYDEKKHRAAFLSHEMIATSKDITERSIGIGDDIFMLGRFVDHDGGTENRPAARFGNVSIMSQPVTQKNGARLPSHILDVHSRTGYSGSPVFVYRTPGGDFTVGDIMLGGPKARFLFLLGVHWGQFPEKWEIKSGGTGINTNAAPVIGSDRYIEGMGGMTLALPATEIMKLLERPKMKAYLDEVKENVRKVYPDQAVEEVAASTVPATDNPSHKEDFTRLLGAAVKEKK